MLGRKEALRLSPASCSGCPHHRVDCVGSKLHQTKSCHICKHPMWLAVSPQGVKIGTGDRIPSWCPVKPI